MGNKIFEFIRKERLYLLIFAFVVLLNIAMFAPSVKRSDESSAEKPRKILSVKARSEKPKEIYEGLVLKKEDADKLLSENKTLATLFALTSVLVILLLLLGMIIDGILISVRLSKGAIDIATNIIKDVRWNLWDVVKVVLLFLFFGYIISMAESVLARVLPLINNDNFRMVFNSTVLDIMTVVFIIYFTVGQYKERLVSLGLSMTNFAKNVFYGLAGYVATIPVLAITLCIIAACMSIFKYVPERQPVVELFLKEKNTAFLTYTSLFAAIVGPFIEEFFFRAFMYSAIKKYIGIFWAMIVTAAIFAVLHTNLAGFLPIMVLGVLLAYLYEKTGTLVSSITVHMIHNFSMIMFVFLIKQLKV